MRRVESFFVMSCLVVAVAACSSEPGGSTGDSAMSSPIPLSPSIQVGDTLYISGQGSWSEEIGGHPEGVGPATRQVMLNLKKELDAAGYTFADVVASHVWITDLDKYTEMNSVYASFFESMYPTRTTVGVEALPGGSQVEISMVAVRGEKKVIYPAGGKPGRLPFSPGILVGDPLYLSGQAGVDPATGKLVTGDTPAHVAQTMKNIRAVLQAADMDFSNIVSAYLLLSNPKEFGIASEAYLKFITEDPKPARVPLGAARLPLDSPVEITAIASRRPLESFLPEGMGGSSSYSRGLKAGKEIYLAGVGAGAKQGSVAEQVDNCFERITAILAAKNMTNDDLVEVRIYLANIDDYDAMNAAYRKHFSKRFPTRSTVAVPELVEGLNMFMGFAAREPE